MVATEGEERHWQWNSENTSPIKDKWSKLMIIIWICISCFFFLHEPHRPCIIIGFWYVQTSTPAFEQVIFSRFIFFDVMFMFLIANNNNKRPNELWPLSLWFLWCCFFRYLNRDSFLIIWLLHGKLDEWIGYVWALCRLSVSTLRLTSVNGSWIVTRKWIPNQKNEQQTLRESV